MARTTNTVSGSAKDFLATLVLVVAILYFARDILIPICVAILLAFLLTPAVAWLERRHVGRFVSIALVMVLLLSAIGTVGWAVERQMADVVAQLPNYQDNIQRKIRRIRGAYESRVTNAAKEVEVTLNGAASTNPASQHSTVAASSEAGATTTQAQAAGSPTVQNGAAGQQNGETWSLSRIIGQYSGLVLNPLATLGLILVLAVFILANRKDLRDRILRLVGDARLHITTQALDDAALRITHYLMMQSAINTVYGISVGLGLWIIGILSPERRYPDVLLWGLLAALSRFLPYLGPWIGAALPLVLSLVLFNGAGAFVATLGLYAALEVMTANTLEPWLDAASTGISAIAVLGSAAFWTWLWGPIGLLLSTPMTVCLVALGKYVPGFNFLAVLLGDEQTLEPYIRIYQRLLSFDQAEASELLHQYGRAQGLEHVYDGVMIPALALAEADRRARTVDADRELFVRQAMRDLVERLSSDETQRNGPAPVAPDAGVAVLCLPAHGEADEIVGLMLARLLDRKGRRAIVASHASLAGEMVQLIGSQPAAVVCISALPPAATSHALHLHKRLAAKFPGLPTVVGLWRGASTTRPLRAGASFNERARFATDLNEAVVELTEMCESLLLHQAQRA